MIDAKVLIQSSLKGTVDASKIDISNIFTKCKTINSEIYCPCQTTFCGCGSSLGITEAAAKQIYSHFGYPDGRETFISEGYNLKKIHLWGTHELSTEDVLSWISVYGPKYVEWIDDASCNVAFSDENTPLRILVDFAEAFDRRTALAAVAAVASIALTRSEPPKDQLVTYFPSESTHMFVDSPGDQPMSLPAESLFQNLQTFRPAAHVLASSAEELARHMPSNGRWFKAVSPPKRSLSIYLRFAHKSDIKLPGAERRSMYYKRYGNPNYGGVPGILTHSYRRKQRTHRRRKGASDNGVGDLRQVLYPSANFNLHVKRPTTSFNFVSGDVSTSFSRSNAESDNLEERRLISYDDLCDSDEDDDLENLVDDFDGGLISVCTDPSPSYHLKSTWPPTGCRRDAAICGFGISKQHRRKWPRREYVPQTVIPNFQPFVNDREPWAGEFNSKSGEKFHGFKCRPPNSKINQRLGTRGFKHSLTTVTLLPDAGGQIEPSECQAIKGDNVFHSRQLLTSLSMVADIEEERSLFHTPCESVYTRLQMRRQSERQSGSFSTNRNVWNRLG